MSDADVLLITHDRPHYTSLSLPRLLETVPEGSRVWVWHNGGNAEVLDVVRQHETHPRFHRLHHSPDNVGLRPALNWLWTQAQGTYLSKVDDDSLMQPGWVEHLAGTLEAWDRLGVMGSWRFLPEDWDAELAAPKVQRAHGVTLLRNHWVQGSGHLFRRSLVDELGPLAEKQSFVGWCLRAAHRGYHNGWPMPFVREEHLDDPRHPLTAFTDEAAYQAALPLSAKHTGALTLDSWLQQTLDDARAVQSAGLDIRDYVGWRRKVIHARRRARKLLTGDNAWR